MKKSVYQSIANTLNKSLFMGEVTVIPTENHGYGFGKYSILLNDDAYEIVKGEYHDNDTVEVFQGTFTVNGVEYYLEPVTSFCYDVAVL